MSNNTASDTDHHSADGGDGASTVSAGTSGSSGKKSAGGSSSKDKSSTSDKQSSVNSFKLMLLTMMVLQNTSTVLVGRYTRSAVAKDQLYSVNHLLLVIECTKFLLSAGLEFYSTNGRLYQSLQLHVFQRPADALKILVPALLYLVQNFLLYTALSNLTAPIFQVTYQGKLVTTALVSVVMLQRSYSPQQWICLVGLSLGVATVVLDTGSSSSKPQSEKAGKQNLALGLMAVSIACLSSALAGVYFEKVLKRPSSTPGDSATVQPASLWMRNMQLAFFSVVIAFCQGEYARIQGKEDVDLIGKPYFHGFSGWAWILVCLQAGGGLLVAAVIKVRAINFYALKISLLRIRFDANMQSSNTFLLSFSPCIFSRSTRITC